MVTDGRDQRQRFIDDVLTARWTMSELCARYGISRPTGYFWRERFQASGRAGLERRRSTPHTCPHQTAPSLEAQIVAARRRLKWGGEEVAGVPAGPAADRAVAGREYDQ
jgi:transposase-like protein